MLLSTRARAIYLRLKIAELEFPLGPAQSIQATEQKAYDSDKLCLMKETVALGDNKLRAQFFDHYLQADHKFNPCHTYYHKACAYSAMCNYLAFQTNVPIVDMSGFGLESSDIGNFSKPTLQDIMQLNKKLFDRMLTKCTNADNNPDVNSFLWNSDFVGKLHTPVADYVVGTADILTKMKAGTTDALAALAKLDKNDANAVRRNNIVHAQRTANAIHSALYAAVFAASPNIKTRDDAHKAFMALCNKLSASLVMQ